MIICLRLDDDGEKQQLINILRPVLSDEREKEMNGNYYSLASLKYQHQSKNTHNRLNYELIESVVKNKALLKIRSNAIYRPKRSFSNHLNPLTLKTLWSPLSEKMAEQ